MEYNIDRSKETFSSIMIDYHIPKNMNGIYQWNLQTETLKKKLAL